MYFPAGLQHQPSLTSGQSLESDMSVLDRCPLWSKWSRTAWTNCTCSIYTARSRPQEETVLTTIENYYRKYRHCVRLLFWNWPGSFLGLYQSGSRDDMIVYFNYTYRMLQNIWNDKLLCQYLSFVPLFLISIIRSRFRVSFILLALSLEVLIFRKQKTRDFKPDCLDETPPPQFVLRLGRKYRHWRSEMGWERWGLVDPSGTPPTPPP